MIESTHSGWQRDWFAFSASGLLMVAGSAAMLWLSLWFGYTSDPMRRPILVFVALMTAMFVVHLVGLRAARRLETGWSVVGLIWLVAILCRMVVLPSMPIQEVDLYRYLWDGQATLAGVSPFRYSPAQVVEAVEHGSADPQLNALARHASRHPSLEVILRRVHFAELPTVYPVVSQAVFATVGVLTPAEEPPQSHVVAMKAAIVCFDLTTLAVVCWLLRLAGFHPAWSITYGWNPLILKEFAGSGHLDSIAVFLTMLAVALTVKGTQDRRGLAYWVAAASFLALGFGAKLYPIILLPWLLGGCLKACGYRRAAVTLASFLVVALATLLPLRLRQGPTDARPGNDQRAANAVGPSSGGSRPFESPDSVEINDTLEPPIPGAEQDPGKETDEPPSVLPPTLVSPPAVEVPVPQPPGDTRSTDGIQAFLTRWEMNDLFFLLLVENLRPGEGRAWFCVVSRSAREKLCARLAGTLGVSEELAAFGLARAVTVAAFGGCLLGWIICMDINSTTAQLRTAFLVVALFWMLSPTLNPWYWSWALPLVPFARSRGWLLVSGMLVLYYTRFLFLYHADSSMLAWLPYHGARNFDWLVVFAEHLPWLCLLAYGAVRGGAGGRSDLRGVGQESAG